MAEQAVKKENDGKVLRPAREWPDRLKASLFVLFLTAFAAAAIVILKNDLVNKKIIETQSAVLDYIGAKGFALEDIVIT